MSSILPATSADPVGAVALLECGDPLELERFVALENAMWEETTLAPTFPNSGPLLGISG